MNQTKANQVDDNRRVVLVTGGAGYIGSHACKALSRAGFLPVSFDNLHRGHRELVKWGPLEEGDLRDAERIGRVMEEYQPVAVMHFAALAYVGESVEQPDWYFDNNVQGSANLLAAMQASGCKALVFSSTCATYGEPMEVPIPESHPQNPVNPYGETKLQVEQMIGSQAREHGLGYINLRYFNAAGADPEGETGEWHEPETHLIPLALQAAAGKREGLEIFGDDYPTPDGTCIRDYIHVSDLADAHVLAVQHLLNGGESASFNLANGYGFSVMEVIDAVARTTGMNVPSTIAPRRAGDPPALVGDASAIRSRFGWKPRFAALDSIVETAWRFEHSFQPSSE